MSWSERLLLFHNALKWVLVLSGEVHHLCHFGLRHLVGEDPAFSDAIVVNMQHNSGRVLSRFVEEALQNVNDELHGRVVVVQEKDPVEIRPLGARLRLGDDRRAGAIVVVAPGRAGARAFGQALRRNDTARNGLHHAALLTPEPDLARSRGRKAPRRFDSTTRPM